MFSTKSDNDRGINTFSPKGRIFQVEYAIEAIKLGSSAIGIKSAEGVVQWNADSTLPSSPLSSSRRSSKSMPISAVQPVEPSLMQGLLSGMDVWKHSTTDKPISSQLKSKHLPKLSLIWPQTSEKAILHPARNPHLVLTDWHCSLLVRMNVAPKSIRLIPQEL